VNIETRSTGPIIPAQASSRRLFINIILSFFLV
jgi:hypothetical protein